MGFEENESSLSPDQINVFGDRNYVDSNVDEKLAKYIYEFLNEKSNRIPTPEFVSQVAKEATGDEIFTSYAEGNSRQGLISRGYGVDVTDKMRVSIQKMNSDIIHVITPEDYFKLDKAGKRHDILVDRENEDGYDLGRVDALQDVLTKTNEMSMGRAR